MVTDERFVISNKALDVAVEALCERRARLAFDVDRRGTERMLFQGVHDTSPMVRLMHAAQRDLAATDEAVRQLLAERRRRIDNGDYPPPGSDR